MWRARCRCSCWMCVPARSASSRRSGATRIRRGRPTAATWRSYPIVPGTGSCGSLIWIPAASGRCCSRAARGCRLGLPDFRRPPRRTPDPWREALEMKRLSLLALAIVAGAVTAAACGGPKPPPAAPTAAKQYLVSHGIDGGRIETSSYGEERPLAQGHDEGAWAQNRRDEFEIIGGGDVLRRP